MPKNGEYVKFRNYERKIKLAFINYTDFESILLPEDNRNQNPEAPDTNKYQKYIAAVMAINKYALMISLVSFLKHTQVKMQLTILLII